MPASVDPKVCPLCGRDNTCAMASAGDATAANPCWCTNVAIPAEVLARIPVDARGRACLCRACAAGAAGRVVTRAATDPGGRAAVLLCRDDDQVLVSLQGAQVLSWCRAGEELLWQATNATFVPGKPVRGGIPLVFPWFGDHPAAGHPAHGFARTLDWQQGGEQPEHGVSLQVEHSGDPGWPHAVGMRLQVLLDPDLHLVWTVHNRGPAPIRFEQALHTYLPVGDVHEASVHGLEHVPCSEHAAAPAASWDRGAPLRFAAETDRIFQGVPDTITLRAPALRRELDLSTTNARSTIVWNPWPAKTARLAQMAADDWRTFVCIESANVREHAVSLAGGAATTMQLRFAVRPLATAAQES